MSEHHEPSRNPSRPRLPRACPRILPAMLLGLLAGLAGPAVAQDNEQDEERGGTVSTLLEEVTVTARKREESGQQVPLSISAFSGDVRRNSANASISRSRFFFGS